MKQVIIALKLADITEKEDGYDYIGADKGALTLAESGIHMVAAIGDFDSVNKEDLAKIKEYASETTVLNPIKDDSDAQAAIDKALSLGYEHIELRGALGGRMDHAFLNIRLLLAYAGKVTIRDERNLITALPPGKYVLKKDEYPYISFFTEKNAVLSLHGFAYPLERREVSSADLYTGSNELCEETGTVIVEKNPVLLFRSRD